MENNLELVFTEDGSHSLRIPSLNEGYHSTHGALSESMHVFINAGFHKSTENPLHILEIGFGTGLNAILTLREAEKTRRQVIYDTIEGFPLEKEIYEKLNYAELVIPDKPELFYQLHDCVWEQLFQITPFFAFRKMQQKIESNIFLPNKYHLIYFDAFAPQFQPELWTVKIFTRIYESLQSGGILVTYCCKGDVKRALKAAGFSIEKLPGPKGKREILRARKPNQGRLPFQVTPKT